MMETPPPVPASSTSKDDLRQIAHRQKVILIYVLVYILAIAGQFLIPPEQRFLVGIGMLTFSVVAVVFVIMLAAKLYGTAHAIICGVLIFVPLIGLIVLLILNAKATNVLKENGIAVGLLGAKGNIV